MATEGPAGGPITLRVIGGAGADALDDSASGGTRFYDFEDPSTVAKGRGTHEDGEPWERRPAKPEETAWLEWRDWGSRTIPRYQLWWEPDTGVVLAGGFTRQSWGFRKSPYASLQGVQLQYSTGRQKLQVQLRRRVPTGRTPLSTSSSTRRPRASRTSTTSARATTPPSDAARRIATTATSTPTPTPTGSRSGRTGP